MSADMLMTILNAAATNCKTVTVSLLMTGDTPNEREVEPYSVHPKDGRPTLFCWDLATKRIASLPLEGVVAASVTTHSFAPRYEIEL